MRLSEGANSGGVFELSPDGTSVIDDALLRLLFVVDRSSSMQVSDPEMSIVSAITDIVDSRQQQLIVDPGIGFGKNVSHNLTIINRLDQFLNLGRPIAVGISRKLMMLSKVVLPQPFGPIKPSCCLSSRVRLILSSTGDWTPG